MGGKNHEYPTYYQPDSCLSIQFSDSTRVSVTVVKAFTPFTISEVLLVRLNTDSPNPGLRRGSLAVLKVYDPRFSHYRFEMGSKTPWSHALELQASQSYPRPFHPYPMYQSTWDFHDQPEDDDPLGWEDWHYKYTERNYQGEVLVYNALAPLQGDSVPRLYYTGTLLVEEPRAVYPKVLLLEYIDNAKTALEIKELDTQVSAQLITPSHAKSALEIIASFGSLGVIHGDLSAGNLLVQENRIVVIDFGESCVREQEDDEEWTEAVRMNGDSHAIRNIIRWVLDMVDSKEAETYAGYHL